MSFKRFIPVMILGVLCAGSAATAAYFHKELKSLKKNPQIQVQQEAEALITRVSQVIVLPKEERPSIATVTDLEKLKEQAFFANAAVGDKVLIYTGAKKAYLYRPSEHKVIDVAPVSVGEKAPVVTTGDSN